MEHDPYTDADKDRPNVICDGNGSVTLYLCNRCGKGEAELWNADCVPVSSTITHADHDERIARVSPTILLSSGRMFSFLEGIDYGAKVSA